MTSVSRTVFLYLSSPQPSSYSREPASSTNYTSIKSWVCQMFQRLLQYWLYMSSTMWHFPSRNLLFLLLRFRWLQRRTMPYWSGLCHLNRNNFSCHPGVSRTLSLLFQHFRWPSLWWRLSCCKFSGSMGFHRLVSHQGTEFTFWFCKEFCRLLVHSVSLSSGFQPQSSGQTERYNQEMETALLCSTSQSLSSSSHHLLIWVEYACNLLPVTPTSLSPFQSVYGYQPDLKGEACVPSAQALVHYFHLTWKRVGSVLIHTNLVYQKAMNHHRTLAPRYQMGQNV